MTTLEQQCEEIRAYVYADPAPYKPLKTQFDVLFEYIAELRVESEKWKSTATRAAATAAGAIHRAENLEASMKVFREDCDISAKRAEAAEVQLAELRSTLACRDNHVASLRIQLAQANQELAELRRPSDAKDIQRIQHRVRYAGWSPVLAMPGEATPWTAIRQDFETLFSALAESQRNCSNGNATIASLAARLADAATEIESAKAQSALLLSDMNLEGNSWLEECNRLKSQLAESQRECAILQTEKAVFHRELLEERERSNGAHADWQKTHARLQGEIARLTSPPEERRDIAERQAERRADIKGYRHFTWADSCLAADDISILLGDCAAWRNAHALVMAERDAARAKCAELEQHCNGIDDENIKLLERIDLLEAKNAELTIANEAMHGTMGAQIERLEAALRCCNTWLRSALDCKSWVWDVQHWQAADESYRDGFALVGSGFCSAHQRNYPKDCPVCFPALAATDGQEPVKSGNTSVMYFSASKLESGNG